MRLFLTWYFGLLACANAFFLAHGIEPILQAVCLAINGGLCLLNYYKVANENN